MLERSGKPVEIIKSFTGMALALVQETGIHWREKSNALLRRIVPRISSIETCLREKNYKIFFQIITSRLNDYKLACFALETFILPPVVISRIIEPVYTYVQ